MIEVVSERGYPETRVVDVIEVAGVSRKTFYELFSSKEDCFLATYDVLLGNLLPRWHLVAGNFLATVLSLLGICALVGLLIWGTAVLVDVNLSLREITDGVLNLWPITVVFGAEALLCSALFHRRALAISIPALLLFGMYLVDAIGRASEVLEDW